MWDLVREVLRFRCEVLYRSGSHFVEDDGNESYRYGDSAVWKKRVVERIGEEDFGGDMKGERERG